MLTSVSDQVSSEQKQEDLKSTNICKGPTTVILPIRAGSVANVSL